MKDEMISILSSFIFTGEACNETGNLFDNYYNSLWLR